MEQLIKRAENLAKKRKYKEAFVLLEEAESRHVPIASYALATWYLHGRHVRKDLRKGFEYLTKASKGNIKEAFYDLAVCYEKGSGTPKNLEKAFQNYLEASLLGDKDSFYEIVRCLYYGIGVKKNRELSTLIYDKVFNLSRASNSKRFNSRQLQSKKVPRLQYA